MRAVVLLEDMGPSGDTPGDHAKTLTLNSARKPCSPRHLPHLTSPHPPPCAIIPPQGEGGTGKVDTGVGVGVGGWAAVKSQGIPGMLEALTGGGGLEAALIEWERWRSREEEAFSQRLREKDLALEEKWVKRDEQRREGLARAQAEYTKLESKLRKALSEVEARERALKAREEGWRSEHAQKLSDLQLLQRRLREESKHQVDLERMKSAALEKQLSTQSRFLEEAKARGQAVEEEFDKYRQAQRRSTEGALRQELLKAGAAKAELEAQVERERGAKNKALLEKEEYRGHIHKLARALKRHQERENTFARRELEQLRLEYLAKEERLVLDGDRNELRSIKQELDELR
ncbi:unnamed protein product, partial [Discosporangium mesarthrocarpum]